MKRRNELNQIIIDKPFMEAVSSCDLAKIKEMIEKGANVNAINTVGCTALMLAGNLGHVDIMEYLNQKGAKIVVKTIYNDLAVSVPIRHGYIDVIQFYISHGVDLNAPGSSNQSALHLAVQAHRDALTPDFTSEKKRKMLELLLGSGATNSLNLEDKDGLTPLMISVVGNDIATFQWLIEVGSDITFKNKKGQDAFDIAKLFNRQDMVEILQNKLPKKSVQSGNSYEFFKLIDTQITQISPEVPEKKL